MCVCVCVWYYHTVQTESGEYRVLINWSKVDYFDHYLRCKKWDTNYILIKTSTEKRWTKLWLIAVTLSILRECAIDKNDCVRRYLSFSNEKYLNLSQWLVYKVSCIKTWKFSGLVNCDSVVAYYWEVLSRYMTRLYFHRFTTW